MMLTATVMLEMRLPEHELAEVKVQAVGYWQNVLVAAFSKECRF